MKRYLAIIILNILFAALSLITMLTYFHQCDFLPSPVEIITAKASTPFSHRLLTPLAITTSFMHGNSGLRRTIFWFNTAILFFLLRSFFKFLRDKFSSFEAFTGVVLLVMSFIAAASHSMSCLLVGSTPETHGMMRMQDFTQPLFFLLLVGIILQKREWLQYPIFTMTLFKRETSILKQWLWYPAFTLALLNRETAVFLLPALGLVWWRHLGFKRATVHCALSVGVFVAIKLFFAHAMGCSMGWWGAWAVNIIDLQKWQNLLIFGLTFGGCWIFIPMGFKKIDKDYLLLLSVIPLYMAFMFQFGNIRETRIFNELAIIVIPCALYGMRQIMEVLNKEGGNKI